MNTPVLESAPENFPTKRIFRICLFAAAALLCLPNGIFSGYYLCESFRFGKPDLCLDQSWHTALNLALERSLVFGDDFVFTYGPLGFLSTRTQIGIDPIYLLLFDVFVIVNIIVILRYSWRVHPGATSIAISLLFCYLAPFGDTSFKLLVIMIFWLQLAIHRFGARFFVVPFIVALVSFFIKLNTSFLAIFIFYLYFAGSILVHRKANAGQILLAALMPVSLLLCAYLLNVNLTAYTSTGLELIGKYNDAMNFIGWQAAKYTLFIAIAAITSLIVFFWLFWRDKTCWRRLTTLFTFGLVIFVLYKQSVVRADVYHLFTFFYFAPVIWLFYLLFHKPASPRANLIVATGSVLTVLIGVLPLRHSTEAGDFNPFRSINYFSQLAIGTDDREKIKIADSFKLPDEIRSIIGRRGVDIIPWNVDLIYFNDLNYRPRPVFQSYVAYSGALMELNRRMYEGPDAPEFIIFSDETVDGRYGFFDDMGAKVAIFEHYDVRSRFDFGNNEYLLLQRAPGGRRVAVGDPTNRTISMNQEYFVENSDMSYLAKINIDYSCLGNVSRVLYQPLSLQIVFTLTDGTVREHRAVVPILEGGVIINPLVETTADYELFFRGENEKLKKVRSFRLEPALKNGFEGLNEMNYKDPMRIESREIKYDRTGKIGGLESPTP